MSLYFFLGGFTASLTASYIFNTIGWINSLLLLYVLEIIFSLLGLLTNIYLLYTIRFMNGYIGCFYTYLAPLMVLENMPFKYKCKFDNLLYLFITMGVMTGFSFGFDLLSKYWYILILSDNIFNIPKMIIIIIFYYKESP